MFHWRYYLVEALIHIQSLRSHVCVYTHILRNIELLIGQEKETIWTAVNAAYQSNFSAFHLGSRAIYSSALN